MAKESWVGVMEVVEVMQVSEVMARRRETTPHHHSVTFCWAIDVWRSSSPHPLAHSRCD